MNQRDVIVFYSPSQKKAYLATNTMYSGKTVAELKRLLMTSYSASDVVNGNFKEGSKVEPVRVIAEQYDFSVDVRSNQGEAKSEKLKLAKNIVKQQYVMLGYEMFNGRRR
ncbi:TPA: hypothetical protein GRI54_22990 [Vibrio parahaemolyticus]|uniref:hypothetical protein n=1 Tax=Vibrio harveyi group TaxID=717610 RepID=UPI00063ED03E|nr:MULTISPECIES: hypothetical protein [Vibrio harveyi group]EHK7406994.1 hypothetical protein [Vibrio parahaemolyticus]KLI82977.1 hypothetical protein AAY62_21870 [Vibrio parahaemolyticus]MCZ0761662.1 hypothetical protein [Vibrio diabolicus]HAS6550678.1 hypothetical protein [Vibrio parahaemolyticus]HAS6736282.1 hypothetical protein [Vibrio parahaemolyticus]